MDVRGSGRSIEDKIVDVAPVGITYELLEGIACHTSTPERCLVGIDEEADAEHLHSVLLHGHDEVAAVDALAIGTGILYPEHLGH